MKLLTAHSSLVQQPIRWMGCFLFLVICSATAQAQLQVSHQQLSGEEISLHKSIVSTTTVQSVTSGNSSSIRPQLQLNGIWLPEYARENPAGHAPLCRIETGLENRMRIPLWIKAGGTQNIPQFGTGNLYLRMKLLRF